MKIKNVITGKVIHCEPTEEALKKENIDFFNMQLLIDPIKDIGFLIPLQPRCGNSYSENDEFDFIEGVKLTFCNFLFNNKKFRQEYQRLINNDNLNKFLIKRKQERENFKLIINYY
jgi:hypothetical protein